VRHTQLRSKFPAGQIESYDPRHHPDGCRPYLARKRFRRADNGCYKMSRPLFEISAFSISVMSDNSKTYERLLRLWRLGGSLKPESVWELPSQRSAGVSTISKIVWAHAFCIEQPVSSALLRLVLSFISADSGSLRTFRTPKMLCRVGRMNLPAR
jgi:hypothetical protein